MKNNYILMIFLLIFSKYYSANDSLNSEPKSLNKTTVHIISIGINDDNTKLFNHGLKNCENDAVSINDKIIADKAFAFKSKQYNAKLSISIPDENAIVELNSHVLIGNNATLENIRLAFKNVIQKSVTNDFFYLFFAGTMVYINNSGEALMTFNNKDINSHEIENYDYLRVVELASLINQISAKNQLVISESGYGKNFAEELQVNLFELNPEIAINTERNRIILTTQDLGYDSSKCNEDHGPLTNYILDSGNIFEVFQNFNNYVYLLNKSEVNCSPRDTKYYLISREEDYKMLFKKHSPSHNISRGSVANQIKSDDRKNNQTTSKTYALVIATNKYSENQTDWDDLKNPINDANVIGKILEEKYNVSIIKLFDQPKQHIIKEIITIKKSINENDKLIVFIAGHGYYSKDFSQGYIVTIDSISLKDDLSLDTYIPLSTLNNLLDGFICKPIFTILDICYGSSFELNNADLVVENYSNTQFDNGLEKFIQDTNTNYSRIMLASGEGEVPDFWKNSLNHSPFASKLIQALEKEKQFISPGKLFSYVRGNTTKPILKKFGKHEVFGDFLLKKNDL